MKKYQRIQTNKFGFIANHYSIRKFSVGTASIIVGSLLFLGNPAHAAEANTTQNEPATHQENKVETNIDPIIIDQPQNQAATNNQTPKTEQNHTQANKQQTKSNQAAAVTSDSKSQNDAQASPKQSSTLKQDAVKQQATQANTKAPTQPATQQTREAQPVVRSVKSATSETTEDFEFQVNKDKTKQKSTMNQYMNHPGKLVHANNKYYFEAELNHAKWWKSFEFYDENNNKLNTVVTKDDTSKNIKTIRVEVASGTQQLISKVHIIVPVINYDHEYTTQIAFAKPVPQPAKAQASKAQALDVQSTQKNAVKPETLAQAKNVARPSVMTLSAKKPASQQAKSAAVTQTAKYKVQKDKSTETSVMDGYMEHPGKFIKENGKTYFEVTLKNADWWKSFQFFTPQNKELTTTVVKHDKKADTKTIRVEVKPGMKQLISRVHIVVPAINYDNKYQTTLLFETPVPELTTAKPETPKTKPANKTNKAKTSTTKPTKANKENKANKTKKVDKAKNNAPKVVQPATTVNQHSKAAATHKTIKTSHVSTTVNHDATATQHHTPVVASTYKPAKDEVKAQATMAQPTTQQHVHLSQNKHEDKQHVAMTKPQPAQQSHMHSLPNTGQENATTSASIFGSLLALGGSILLFGRKRKEQR
ncbi:YSIRK signal domain/LPXTG anchor domain surface protein [Staphylococcus sp. HMSC74F12]|uniref:NEAT domain-containing protein n=1 Tax=Staphylococcus sp. HMSC74F12 TaxID=1608905 RepID=UPI0008A9E868|nr:NEAT domain-containing protein [Staphylococcus sp. HMSC74F12]OHS72891.1 YSIRK signal domain/LPXTG anchor domain surface protein [Staphylococcus sp. HMSC74F12]